MKHKRFLVVSTLLFGLIILPNKSIAQNDDMLLQTPVQIKKIAKQIQSLNLDPEYQMTITTRRRANHKLSHLQQLASKMQQTIAKVLPKQEMKTSPITSKKMLSAKLVNLTNSLSQDTATLVAKFNADPEQRNITQSLKQVQNIALRMENITNPKQDSYPLEAGTWDAGFKKEKEATEANKNLTGSLKRTNTW